MDSVLTVKCKLTPDTGQRGALQATAELFANGCNTALKLAREHGEFRRFKLHHLAYPLLRELGLSANLAVQAIARVGKRKGARASGFKVGSVTYDQRTLSINSKAEIVSLTTTAGRLKIPMHIGDYQRQLIRLAASCQGGQLVMDRAGRWFINLTLRFVDTGTPDPTGRVLGIDFGQKVLASLSSGERFTGGELKAVRLRHLRTRAALRSKLDRKGTKGLKRAWQRLSGKEARFVRHSLHVMTRRIVDGLQPGDTVAIEDLTGLRARTERIASKARHMHNLWPYHLFRAFLTYKAQRRGITVVAVDPRNTSKTCSRCGHCSKGNRRRQAQFQCEACGYSINADLNASFNIALRAGSTGKGDVPAPLILGKLVQRLHPQESQRLLPPGTAT